MANIKPSSRYSSMDSRSSSTSDPLSAASSSSSSHKKCLPSSNFPTKGNSSSRALVHAKTIPQGGQNLGSLLRKLVDKRSGNGNKMGPAMVPPHDPIAKEMKKAGKGGGNFSAFSRKLFQKGGTSEKKALTEVKTNTRTLAMVLRSERELLFQNKEYEDEISQLHLLLEEKNREVEKLKDLCLKQREEIKGLKDAVLFPDETNLEMQELVQKQGFELKQAKQVIPALQTQVESLTADLQSLALDLAQVKADKHNSPRTCIDRHIKSPRTCMHDNPDETLFPSTDYCSAHIEESQYGSPEEGMFFKDFNPCLTPHFSKLISEDYGDDCDSPSGGMLSDLTNLREENEWSRGKLASQNLFSSP